MLSLDTLFQSKNNQNQTYEQAKQYLYCTSLLKANVAQKMTMTASLTNSKILSGTGSKFRQSRSLPPLEKKQEKIGKYIAESFKYMQQGCYESGKLKIDGNYGDYRMSIFRLKDRNKYLRTKPTIFTINMTNKLYNISQNDPECQKEIMRIINTPTDVYNKKMGQIYEMQSKFKIPDAMIRGMQQSLRQQEDTLMYSYLPNEQKKWFKTIDNTEQCQAQLAQLRLKLSMNKKNCSEHITKKTKSKKKYMFKYQDPSYLFCNSSNLF